MTYFQSTRCQCYTLTVTFCQQNDTYFTVTHLLPATLQITHSKDNWWLLLPTRQCNWRCALCKTSSSVTKWNQWLETTPYFLWVNQFVKNNSCKSKATAVLVASYGHKRQLQTARCVLCRCLPSGVSGGLWLGGGGGLHMTNLTPS
jgi:hypothetical protein